MVMGLAAMLLAAGAACAQTIANPDEIIVTAERRPVRLSQLPLSISALDAAALEQRGVRSTRDLAGRLPNLSVQPGISNGTGAIISIRGIATSADETFGFDNPVGLYLDGVPMPRATAAAIDLLDVERIEVLRGPQGTLFGRNTTGGAISLVPRAPGEDLSLSVRADAGSRVLRLLRGRLDTGKIGALRLAFTAQHEARYGWIDNRLQPDRQRDPGGGTVNGARLALAIDVADGWSVSLSADWLETRTTPPASQLAAAGDGRLLPPLTSKGDLFQPVQPAPVGRWLAAADPVPGCPVLPKAARQTGLCLQDAVPVRDTLAGGLLRVEGRIGGVRLRVTTAYRHWSNAADSADIDGLPSVTGALFTPATLLNGIPADTLTLIPGFTPALAAAVAAQPVPRAPSRLFGAANRRRSEQWTQEIEIRSDADGPVNWTFGLFALHEAGQDRNRQSFGIVLDTVTSVLVPQFGALAPLLAAGLPAGTRDRFLAQPDRVLDYGINNLSLAIYGQASAAIAQRLDLTAGLRITHDRRGMARVQNGILPFTPAERDANDMRARFTQPTGHMTLNWRGDDTLVWARFARGYQSGGYNARQATRLAGNGLPAVALASFAPETLWAAELGGRVTRPGLRLSGALFANWHDDKLVNVVIPEAPTIGTRTVNAGRVRYAGAEVEADMAITKWLGIEASLGITDISVGRFPAVTADGRPGNAADLTRLPNAPPLTASLALQARWPLAGGGTLSARGGWVHVAPQRFFGNPLFAPFDEQIRAGASNRFDLDIRLQDLKLAGSRFTVALWAQGLGRPAAVRGVDVGQLGFGTLLFAEPARAGVTLAARL
jgi:iron complex outermembrane receptor protein